MPYQTGTFSSMTNLATTIKAFAVANGWTQNGDVLSKGAVYVTVVGVSASPNRVDIQGGDGETGGVLDNPSPLTLRMNDHINHGGNIPYPGTYHLFSHSAPDCIFCVINYNSIYHQHLAFGDINKYGTWGGGPWFAATTNQSSSNASFYSIMEYCACDTSDSRSSGCFLYPCASVGNGTRYGSQMLCDIDGNTWLRDVWRNSSNTTYGFCGSGYAHNYMRKLDPTHEQPVLAPCNIIMYRPATMSSVIGDIPHVRYLRVDNYDPATIITIGSNKWMVFPHRSKGNSVAGWAIAYDGP